MRVETETPKILNGYVSVDLWDKFLMVWLEMTATE